MALRYMALLNRRATGFFYLLLCVALCCLVEKCEENLALLKYVARKRIIFISFQVIVDII